MDEILFAQGNISISKSAAKFGNITYPIVNIGSVSMDTLTNHRRIPLMILGIASGIVFGYSAHWAAGLLIACVLIFIATRLKDKARLILKTSSGDVNALMTVDAALVQNVKQAIERAFVRS
jgi:hypothetical protein